MTTTLHSNLKLSASLLFIICLFIQFLKVSAKHQASIPAGHPGEGQPAWLFVGEIVVN